MLSATTSRGRALKRAPRAVQRIAALEAARLRLRDTLAHYDDIHRAVLSLMLVERLTPAEAARALDLPIEQVMTLYRALLTDLQRAFSGRLARPSRRGESPSRIVPMNRARRA